MSSARPLTCTVTACTTTCRLPSSDLPRSHTCLHVNCGHYQCAKHVGHGGAARSLPSCQRRWRVRTIISANTLCLLQLLSHLPLSACSIEDEFMDLLSLEEFENILARLAIRYSTTNLCLSLVQECVRFDTSTIAGLPTPHQPRPQQPPQGRRLLVSQCCHCCRNLTGCLHARIPGPTQQLGWLSPSQCSSRHCRFQVR